MAVYGYIRRSSSKQEISPKRQKEQMVSYAMGMGLNIDHFFNESPVSGKSRVSERPELARMLSQLKPGDIVMAASPTRLARNQMVARLISGQIHDRHAQLMYADGTVVDFEDSLSVLINSIKEYASEIEREQISMRTKSAMAILKKTKAFGRPGRQAFGYTKGDNGELIVNEEEKELGDKILGLYDAGLPQRLIADELNDQGYRNRNGSEYTQRGISHILKRLKAA